MTEEQIRKKQNEVQMEALGMWKKNNFNGCIEVATGVGKTRIGVIAGCEFIKRGEQKLPTLITCSKTTIVENWPKEIALWGYADYINSCIVECYQTSYKRKNENFGTLIGDEIHKGLTPEYSQVFDLSFDKRLLMTAKLSPTNKQLLQKLNIPIVFTYTREEARKDGIISELTVVEKKVYLGVEDSAKYLQYTDKMEEVSKKILATFKSGTRVNLWATVQNWRNHHNGYFKMLAFTYLKAVRERASLLYNSEAKIIAAADFIEHIVKNRKDAKIIVYSEHISPIELLDEELNRRRVTTLMYHSKKTKAQNQNAIDTFDKGVGFFNGSNYQVLLSAKGLTEGLNIKTANVAVVLSTTSNNLDSIQREGRVSRRKEDNRSLVIHITGCLQVYEMNKYIIKDTKDKDWLNNSGTVVNFAVEDPEQVLDLF